MKYRVSKCGDFWFSWQRFGWIVYSELFEINERFIDGKMIIRLKAK